MVGFLIKKGAAAAVSDSTMLTWVSSLVSLNLEIKMFPYFQAQPVPLVIRFSDVK